MAEGGSPHIEIRNVSKIFGPDPASVLAQLRAGHSKQKIMEETGHILGVRQVSLSVGHGQCMVVIKSCIEYFDKNVIN